MQIRGGPAAVIGDGEGKASAGHCRGVMKNPGGKADLLRLIREPEDLPGGCFVSSATPDGKGSSIRRDGTLFFVFGWVDVT